MTKIVIHKTYGSFEINKALQNRLLELGFIPKDDERFLEWVKSKFDKRHPELLRNPALWDFAIKQLIDALRYALAGKPCYWIYFPRDHPLLIEAIEGLEPHDREMMKIIEIPDDVDWIICGYEGIEWIAERHKIWR